MWYNMLVSTYAINVAAMTRIAPLRRSQISAGWRTFCPGTVALSLNVLLSDLETENHNASRNLIGNNVNTNRNASAH